MCKHNSYTDCKKHSGYRKSSSGASNGSGGWQDSESLSSGIWHESKGLSSEIWQDSESLSTGIWQGSGCQSTGREQECGCQSAGREQECGCQSSGKPGIVIGEGKYANLIQNGGMERSSLIGMTPESWTIIGSGARTGATTLPYTGAYAVFLNNAATLAQIIQGVTPGKQYEFSFYATYGLNQDGGRGLTTNGSIGLNANIYYMQMGTQILLTSIPILPGNFGTTYGFYRIITPRIPTGASSLLVEFVATDGTLVPGTATDVGVLIDDVAFVRA